VIKNKNSFFLYNQRLPAIKYQIRFFPHFS